MGYHLFPRVGGPGPTPSTNQKILILNKVEKVRILIKSSSVLTL